METLTGAAEAVVFRDWVAPHLPAMWLLATRLAGLEGRDDVYQEALETAWRRRSTYDPARGTPLTWLLVVVSDRSRKARRRGRDTTTLPDLPAPTPDHDARLDLHRAIIRLPRRQRLAVELHYSLDLTVAQTAQIMGCSTGTVSSTLSDARRSLRAVLEVQP